MSKAACGGGRGCTEKVDVIFMHEFLWDGLFS